jgi:hypothetical protein
MSPRLNPGSEKLFTIEQRYGIRSVGSMRGRRLQSLADVRTKMPPAGSPGCGPPDLCYSPGSPSVLTNMVASIEPHVAWMAGCLSHMRDCYQVIEPKRDAQSE